MLIWRGSGLYNLIMTQPQTGCIGITGKQILKAFLVTLVLGFLAARLRLVQADTPVVYAVLFYSPSCTHCQEVIAQDVAPLQELYQEQLFILAVSNGSQEGYLLYKAAVDRYGIPPNRQGVPTIIINNSVLVGSEEISERLPEIIEDGLTNGGIDWPDIPGLEEYLTGYGIINHARKDSGESTTGETLPLKESPAVMAVSGSENLTPYQKFALDQPGNSIALIVLVGLLLSLLLTSSQAVHANLPKTHWPAGSIPLLVVIGLLIAVYLSFIEISQNKAMCGPVGNCHIVQQSPYAFLFGVLPIGILGIGGYLAIGAAWLTASYGPAALKKKSIYGLFGLVFLGTLFSTYLTFLEPFVIGASCLWCLTSAVIMTLLLWIATSNIIEQQLKTASQANKIS